MNIDYLGFLAAAAPETIVAVTVLVVLAADLLGMRGMETRARFIVGAIVSCAGCAAAAGWMLAIPSHADAFHGMFVVNSLTQIVKVLLLALSAFTILVSAEQTFTDHVGEHIALVLLSTLGMMLLASAEDILSIFVALELTSIPLYILAGFNKRDPRSSEAALKYFLFGGMSAAFMLFGLSYIYGLTGATNLGAIATAVGAKMTATGGLDPLLVIAMVMTIVGFGFKVAAVPFHLWAPDVYEGSPSASAALIASGSKLASFFVFAKVMMLGFAGAEGSGGWHDFVVGWAPVIAVIAGLSMVLGNFAALAQTSVKRLLAYSAIAHAGYMLLGVMAHGWDNVASLVFYAFTYGLATVGAFGVVSLVEESAGNDKLASFAGFSRRAPVASFAMMIFILSLAGIPPLAGFFGKFYVFAAALKSGGPGLGLLWLVILAIAMSAVSLYYYLHILKQVYVAPLPDGAREYRAPLFTSVILAVLAFVVILLGCMPNLLVGALHESLAALSH